MAVSVNEYKKYHKPNMTTSKYEQSYYVPTNKDKVIGGAIICRSSWERKFAAWCDANPSIIRWGCEVVTVRYRDKGGVDLNECRRCGVDPSNPLVWPEKNYHIDFYIELADSHYDGTSSSLKRILIEIKPYAQTRPPKPVSSTAKLKDQKRFNEAARTYLTNRAKWDAATAYAESHDMRFVVWSEYDLKKLGLVLTTKKKE